MQKKYERGRGRYIINILLLSCNESFMGGRNFPERERGFREKWERDERGEMERGFREKWERDEREERDRGFQEKWNRDDRGERERIS